MRHALKILDIFWIFMFLRHFATVCLLGPWTRETRGIQLMAASLLPAEQQLLCFMPDWVQTLPPSKNVLHRMAWQCGMAWHGLAHTVSNCEVCTLVVVQERLVSVRKPSLCLPETLQTTYLRQVLHMWQCSQCSISFFSSHQILLKKACIIWDVTHLC